MKEPFRKPEHERRTPITSEQKTQLLVFAMRNLRCYEHAKGKLVDRHFAAHEEDLRLLWSVIVEFYEQFHEPPPEHHLMRAVSQRWHDSSVALKQEHLEDLDLMIRIAYEKTDQFFKDLDFRWFTRTLSLWLLEDIHGRLIDAAKPGPGVFCDMPAVVNGLVQEWYKVEQSAVILRPEPFPTNWKRQAPRKFSTGLDFLDRCLGGGDAEGEINGASGPWGGGKTMLGLQMSTTRAQQDWARFQLARVCGVKDHKLRLHFFISYEEPLEQLRIRALSCAGCLDWTRLQDRDWNQLTDEGEPMEPYEQALLKERDKPAHRNGQPREELDWSVLGKAGSPFPREKSRLRAAEMALNRNWRVLDLSGADDSMTPFAGESAAVLPMLLQQHVEAAEELHKCACEVGSVVIDHAIAMAEQHINLGKGRREDMRIILGGLPPALKSIVAVRFHCPVWLLIQLSANANAFAPGKLPHHTDFAECRTMAQNCSFAVSLGTRNSQNLAAFGPTKARRHALLSPRVVRVEGHLNRIVPADNCVIDSVTHRILDSRDAAAVNGPPVDQKPTPAAEQATPGEPSVY